MTAIESRKTLAVATDAIRQVQGSSQATLRAITQLADRSQQTVQAAQPELQRTLVGAREASETAKLTMDRLADELADEIDQIEDNLALHTHDMERPKLARARRAAVKLHRQLSGLRILFHRLEREQSLKRAERS